MSNSQYIIPEFSENCLKRAKKALGPHQSLFVEKFLYNPIQRGAIVVHGLGTGKTYTAIVTAVCYLDLYPYNKVVIISPPSTYKNFIKELEDYGFDIKDPRIEHYTYDGYYKKKDDDKECNKSLLIIDEAHNLRTLFNINKIKSSGGEETDNLYSTKNKKGFEILVKCAMLAHKVILLTATPIVNTQYDIINLMALINGTLPLTTDDIDKLDSDYETFKDYFQNKISFYYPDEETLKKNFPRKIEKYIPIIMDKEYQEQYEKLESGTLDNNLIELFGDKDKKSLDSFYNALRRATSNLINGSSPKISYIIDLISNNPDKKFIIYSNFINTGTAILRRELSKLNISYGYISGDVNKNKRQIIVNSYNNKSIKVIIITKAAAEGVNLFETSYIILMEPVWNEALSEQIIGRAVRYKSHINLPEKDRKVNVYKLVLLKDSDIDEELFEKYLENKGKITNEVIENIKKLMSNINTSPSIDLFLYITSLGKQYKLDNFINKLQKLDTIETSKSTTRLLNAINENVKEIEKIKGNNELNYNDYLKAYKDTIENITDDDLLKISSDLVKKPISSQTINSKNFIFDYHTLITLISDINNNQNTIKKILINTPKNTINSIISLYNKNKLSNIDIIDTEAQKQNYLKKFNKYGMVNLNVKSSDDLLQYISSERYDYVFIIFNYNDDINYVTNCIMRGYAMLNIGGYLLAYFNGKNIKSASKFIDWLKDILGRKNKLYYDNSDIRKSLYSVLLNKKSYDNDINLLSETLKK